MKVSFVYIAIAALVALSCKKEGDDPIMEVPEQNDQAVELFAGDFNSDVHTTSGQVSVTFDGATTNLVFTNFKTDDGPDLRVYLSKDKTDDRFIDLGELKSIEGDFFYELENNTDFDSFNHVLIWCEDFSVLFGHSKLNEQ